MSMKKILLLLPVFAFTAIESQTCQDASVELTAVVQTLPLQITLNWVANTGATSYNIYRKLKTATSWGAVIGTAPGTATQFVDAGVSAGVSYEYRVQRVG